MLSSFDFFLNVAIPNWRQLTARKLNKKLDDIGPIHLRLRHRRCTVFGVPQIVLEPKEEYWLADGVWQNIPQYIFREWAVHVKNPLGPYVYIKNEPGSLYPIDLVHNLEEETEEETRERLKVEKQERWHALLSTANRITHTARSAKYKPVDDKKIEKLARRFIQIILIINK
ncbi:hypothetical protein B9Z55_000721 [Caenorhabditis nigoni]|uniref:PAZ domain-containing protein n=1 Tax=Caenorhabditis nigoni TaxID=1611254 RepID=A0A2G5VUG3_9PELO|nr:hypothetical protein B9Z55_000721 [Caenorhabditis nigoni]